MDFVLIVSALITVTIPVLVPKLRVEQGRMKGWLNGWGVLFVCAAFFTGYGALSDLRAKQVESAKQMENTQRILQTIQRESLRLRPDDFQVRLISFTSSGERGGDKPEPTPVHSKGKIGDAFFSCELVALNAPWKLRSGRGGGGRWGYRFYAANLTIGDLEDIQYLDDLEGKTFTLAVPLNELQFLPGTWTHYLDLYVKGRHFSGELDAKGEASITMSFKRAEGQQPPAN